MFDYQKLWKPQVIQKGETLDVSLGTLHLLIHRGQEDWHIAHETEAGDEERCSVSLSDTPFASDRDWTRWILGDQIDQIQLKPRLPDRPVIVRPEMPMGVMPKESVQFFIGIPIWLGICFGTKQGQVIEVPTMKLSNSWFGTFTEGELCYAVKTTAKLNRQDLRAHAHRVVFPLEVRNASKEQLNFERLCLRTQYLNIFQGDTRLWTSKGRVSYRGEDSWSRIVYSTTAPEFDHAGKMLGNARETLQRGALLKTFDSLKQRVDI